MALPGTQVLQLTRRGIRPTDYRQSAHFKRLQAFIEAPDSFMAAALRGEDEGLMS